MKPFLFIVVTKVSLQTLYIGKSLTSFSEHKTVIDALFVHPFESVTVTLYEPALRPDIDSVVSPLDHKYVYGASPDSVFAVKLAELDGVHSVFVMTTSTPVLPVMIKLSEISQPELSITSTV